MSNYEPPQSVETEVDMQLHDSESDDRLVRTHTQWLHILHIYTYYYYSYVQDQLQDVPRCDRPVSPATATSSRAASPATFEPPMKWKRKGSSNDVDDALLLLSKTALERRLLKDKRDAEKQLCPKILKLTMASKLPKPLTDSHHDRGH